MELKELINRLLNSDAVKSLAFEKQVKKLLEELNWKVIHSPYYLDPSTNKLREIDLIARMAFKKKISKRNEIISEISLQIECKSLSNYHIVCDGELPENQRTFEDNQKIWFGLDDYFRNTKLIHILNKTDLSETQKQSIIKNFRDWLFPDGGAIVGDFTPPTYTKIKKFTAFRETNIGNTKTLENSVLWKSFLSLNSAGLGYDNFMWECIESDLLGDIDYVILFKQNLIKSLKTLFFHRLTHQISLHKILLIDSSLWSFSSKLKQLDYFRLIQRTIPGHEESWIDVVNINAADQYFSILTDHYSSFFASTKMERSI